MRHVPPTNTKVAVQVVVVPSAAVVVIGTVAL
jgi:hypothetical protein